MENNINYIQGDATNPNGIGNKIIVHVCNDTGGWGRGFVLALSNKWKKPEEDYRAWFKSRENFGLGLVQFVQVEQDIWVANLIGQHKTMNSSEGLPPIRYEAILTGLQTVGDFAAKTQATIHMPRIGCGLAGGTWDKVEPLIIKALIEKNIAVTVYDF